MQDRRSSENSSSDLPLASEFAAATRTRTLSQQLRARLGRLTWQFSLLLRPAARRVLDASAALAGLILLAPLLVLTALAIRADSPGPVLYSQQRVGKRGRLFTMYKFRSMRVNAAAEKNSLQEKNDSSDGVIFKCRRDPRITRVGRLIRRLSIDELPQLINVLRGDMSLVGPRPALPDEVGQYDAEARKRLQAKPGLTCLWQISGRSDLAFGQQVDLDLRYLSARSLLRDLAIILKTLPAVISGRGAY